MTPPPDKAPWRSLSPSPSLFEGWGGRWGHPHPDTGLSRDLKTLDISKRSGVKVGASLPATLPPDRDPWGAQSRGGDLAGSTSIP
ncbi:hypothetical protein CDL15_Pgr023141 [Punica granatum]|uniref:Uncharacterized protein n=1 Tax=Punica granatum TaxID=22663 RepID=A0A218X4S8_PUNGR|nr:hypothetical protein CDL15_Pgr023141 [Punica granatum]PKI68646.1 hypothetical protein CRG98_010926 [Punica granatum]